MHDEGLLTAEEMQLDPLEQDSIIQAHTRLRMSFLYLFTCDAPANLFCRCLANIETVISSVVQSVQKYTGLVCTALGRPRQRAKRKGQCMAVSVQLKGSLYCINTNPLQYWLRPRG